MKRGIVIFIIGLFLLVFQQGNVTFATELTGDYFDIATNYYFSNNYVKALEYLNVILKLEPENVQAKALIEKITPSIQVETPIVGVVPLIETKKTEDESTTVPPSLVQNPENFVILPVEQANFESLSYNSDYYNIKGQEFYQKKDFDSSIEYFYKSIKLNGKNAQAYNNLAMAYWKKNNKNLAVKYFKRANFLNRKYTQPLVNLSILYGQMGDEEIQLYYLQKAIKYNNCDYQAYYLLGDYYKAREIYPKAIENLKEAIKINPKYSKSYLNIAMCFFETEEFNYALVALNEYLALNPDSDFAMYMMARTNLVQCRYDSAKNDILKAISHKDIPDYQFELAKIEYYMENYQAALDILQQLSKNTSSAEVLNYIGLCNYKLKNIDDAIANFYKAIALDGLRPIYYYNLAQCYKSTGDKKNYLKYVNMGTKITPINYQDFIDLSYIYYDNGNPNYAINTLNDAIKRYPTIKALYLSKLKIFESLNDTMSYNELKDLINERFNIK